MTASTLASVLRSRREAAGLSQAQMAAKLGVSRPHLSRLEHGTASHPSLKVLLQISNHLHVPVEDLSAMTHTLAPLDLPSFGPYLRAKHPDWPETVFTELADFYDFVKGKHSLK